MKTTGFNCTKTPFEGSELIWNLEKSQNLLNEWKVAHGSNNFENRVLVTWLNAGQSGLMYREQLKYQMNLSCSIFSVMEHCY